MPNRKKLLTISEAAALLKVSKASLRRWTNNGQLRCYRVGGRSERRFYLDDLMDFMTVNGNLSLWQQGQDDSDTLTSGFIAEIPEPFQGKHICLFYKNPREQWQLFRSHFLAHIQTDSRTVYLYHGDKDRVINWITSEGLDFKKLQESQTLLLLSSSETYCAEGYFTTDRMLAFWQRNAVDAQNAGVKKLLLTGEMGWATTHVKGYEQLVPYEAALDLMLERYPWVTTVCQYPVCEISGLTVYDNLYNHTHIQLPDRLAPCFCARPVNTQI